MAYLFGDGLDCYAAPADAIAEYWDSGNLNFTLSAGRFTGSQSIQAANTGGWLVKSSGQNDAVHHIVCAFQQTIAVTGSTLAIYFQLSDGATNQVCIVFRSDGAILLTSATPAGTVLATYTGAVTAASTWYAFEFEVVIHPSAGSFAVRKNGNTSNDFSATALNTRPGANSYANKLTVGSQAVASSYFFDDLLWRSDASSVPWVGDLRCLTRRPASDAAVQWTPSSPALPVQTIAFSANTASTNTIARFSAFTAPVSGSVGTVSLIPGVVWTGNVKCSLFASSASTPGAVLGSATPLSTMPSGTPAIFTFGTPVAVTAGTQYWVGIIGDTNVSGVYPTGAGSTGLQQASTSYAAFPTANPATSAVAALVATVNITATGNPNSAMVQDTTQDAATSYVYSSTVGQSDLYGISAIGSTPSSIVAVTTRAYCQKSDAGTRNVAVQLKSGGTTVQGTSTALNTVWSWLYRTDTTDPNGGGPLTAVAVNNMTIGCVVTA
jgi:hypothetical protein